jgi:hypothetical protein
MRKPVARFLLALICAVGAAAVARADMGVPWETKTVASYQITTNETHPDYVFVVFRHGSKGVKDEKSGEWTFTSEAEYVEPLPQRPVTITRDRISFLIVPRATAAQFKTALELGEAVIAGRVEDAIRRDLAQIKRGPWWMESKVIEYRLRRANDTLELVPMNQDESYQCYLVGCGAPALFLVGTIWLIRRRRSHPGHPSNPRP